MKKKNYYLKMSTPTYITYIYTSLIIFRMINWYKRKHISTMKNMPILDFERSKNVNQAVFFSFM